MYYSTNNGGKRLLQSAIPTIFNIPNPPPLLDSKRKPPVDIIQFQLQAFGKLVEDYAINVNVTWVTITKNIADELTGVPTKWIKNKVATHESICKLCKSDLKFSSVCFQALYQHSSKPKHKSVSDLRFSKTACHLYVDSNKNSIGGEKVIQLEFSINEKISAAEAMWLFKVAENDLALRHCDNTPILFQRMFPDSKISQGFTMSRQKASYILQDGLGPLLEKRLCNSITLSQGALTLMFDETTTSQQRKQMDLLCCFRSEDENQVVTKYLTLLFFGRATAEDVKTMLADLRHNERFYLPWDRLFNISADGPNINKAIWRLLNADLHSNGFNGLLPFVSCTLHTVHNAFRKAINVVSEDAEQLAFDLHTWFKVMISVILYSRIPLIRTLDKLETKGV
nr:uncharacterized protein LOC124811287 [Hydra vulgaris]